jgi:predicted kinase
MASNARQLKALELLAGDGGAVIARTSAALEPLRPLLDRRLGAGFVRRCHGDLHLGNILLEEGRPVLFDCIEFGDAFIEIDVLYDLAFLLMDLGFRGRADGANRALNGWLDEAARTFPDALWEGLAALGLFQAVRAAVRAHVHAHQGEEAAARAYLAAALAHLEPSAPVLIAVGGLSGSGKSTFARLLAPRLKPAPGAVILRSDEIRKRLMGCAPAERLPQAAYSAEMGRRVYGAMFATAVPCLKAGWPVILDAVFLDPAERAQARAAAAEAGAAFRAVWLEAPEPVLRSRLRSRQGDASDADETVLEIQLARDPGPLDWPGWREPGFDPLVGELSRVRRRH